MHISSAALAYRTGTYRVLPLISRGQSRLSGGCNVLNNAAVEGFALNLATSDRDRGHSAVGSGHVEGNVGQKVDGEKGLGLGRVEEAIGCQRADSEVGESEELGEHCEVGFGLRWMRSSWSKLLDVWLFDPEGYYLR